MKLQIPNPLSWLHTYGCAAAPPSDEARTSASADVSVPGPARSHTASAAGPHILNAPGDGPDLGGDWESLRSTLVRKNAIGVRPVKAVQQALAFTKKHGVAAINREPRVGYALVAFAAAQKTVIPVPRHITDIDALLAHLRANRAAIHSLDVEALLTLHGLGSEAVDNNRAVDLRPSSATLLQESCAGVPGLFDLCNRSAQRIADSSGAPRETASNTLRAFASTSLRQDSLREWLRNEHLPQLARSSATLHWLLRLAQRPELREAGLGANFLSVVQSLLQSNVSVSLEQLDQFVDRVMQAAPRERATICATATRYPTAIVDDSVLAQAQVPAIAQLLSTAGDQARDLAADIATMTGQLPKGFTQWPRGLTPTTVSGLAALVRRASCEPHLVLADWQSLLLRALKASDPMATELAQMPPSLLANKYQWLQWHLVRATNAAHLRALVAPMQSVLIIDAADELRQIGQSLLKIHAGRNLLAERLHAHGQDTPQLGANKPELEMWEGICAAYAPGAASMGAALCALTKTCFQRFGADRMGRAWEIMVAIVSTHTPEAGVAVLTKLRDGLLATTMSEQNVATWLEVAYKLRWLLTGERASDASEAFAKALTGFGTMLKLEEQSNIREELSMGNFRSPRLSLEALHRDLLKPQVGRGVVKKRCHLLSEFSNWQWNSRFGETNLGDDFMRCALEQVDAPTRDALLDMAGHIVQHGRLLGDDFDTVMKTLMRAFVVDAPPDGHTLARAQSLEALARALVLGRFFGGPTKGRMKESMNDMEALAGQVPADVRCDPAALGKLDLLMGRLRGLVKEETALFFAPSRPSKEGISLGRAIWGAFTGTPPAHQDSVAWRLQQVDAWAKQHPENVKVRASLRKDGYDLWTQEARPQTYRSIIRCARGDEPEFYRNHAQQYKDVLQQLAVKNLLVGDKLVPVTHLFATEDGMETLREQRDAAVTRIRKESEKRPRTNIAQLLNILIRAEPRTTKQAPTSAKARRLTVALTTNFWETLELCGPQIPGCYAPDGIHREKPLMMAIREDNRFLVMRDENGHEMANIEGYMSPHGLVLFPLHSEESRMQTAAVWMTYLRELLQQGRIPQVIFLKNHPSPALYAMAAKTVAPGGAAGTKFSYRKLLFNDPYWDIEPKDFKALDEHAIVLTRENTASMQIPEVDSEAQYAALNEVMRAISKAKDVSSAPLLKVLGLPLRNFIRQVVHGHEATLSGLAQTFNEERWHKDLGTHESQRAAYFARLELAVRAHIAQFHG